MSLWNRLRAEVSSAALFLRLPPAYTWFILRWVWGQKRIRRDGVIYVNSFFPPCPSKAFTRFCGHTVKRLRLPLSCYMSVTWRCPCQCAHCSYSHHPRREMSAEETLAAVRQVRELGTGIIGFTGGEPLLRRDLEDLIAAVSDDTATILFTTGYGLTPERARSLADAGLTYACIGLESSEPEEHDRVRGREGSFDWARRAVQRFRQAGVFTSLSTIAFADRIASGALPRMYALAKEWGVDEFRLPNPVATGGIAGCATVMLTREQLQQVFDFHVEYNRKRDAGPLVTCFAHIESAEMFGCGAGYHHLYVDAAGEVCPCDVTPMSFGNLNERPLRAIWEEMGPSFSRPRSRCLMCDVSHAVHDGDLLPLTPDQTRKVVAPPPSDMPLPRAYRGLLTYPVNDRHARAG